MTTLQSIKKKLNPLGVYNIESGSNIFAELSAYAYALDNHRSNMETALRECFISTSESYGLEIREKVFGNARIGFSDAQRREMLRLRRGFGAGDFTRGGFNRFMESLGVTDYILVESPYGNAVSVTLNNTLSETDLKWIENQIKLIMPAHLVTNVYHGGIIFMEIDSADLTYSEFDNQNRTWAEIDNLQ